MQGLKLNHVSKRGPLGYSEIIWSSRICLDICEHRLEQNVKDATHSNFRTRFKTRQNKMFICAESKSKKSSSECKRVHELIFISVLYVFRNPRRCALAANLYVRPLSRNALVCRQGEVNPLAEKIRIRHNRTSTRMNNDQSLSQLGLTSWSGVTHVS